MSELKTNDLGKRLLAFLAQQKELVKDHLPLFLDLKDAVEERDALVMRLQELAKQNRFILYYNKNREICVISDRPCHPYIIQEGESFKNIETLHDKAYFGEEGVDEALSL